MRLLRRMMEIQSREGAVTDAALEGLSRELAVPLYRLEGLRSFYPVFTDTPAARPRVQVCRDIVCRMRGGADHCQRVREALADVDGAQVEEVSCIGRCDQAPAALVDETPVSGVPEALREYATGGASPPTHGSVTADGPWPTDPYPEADRHYATLARYLRRDDPKTARDEVVTALKDSGLRGLGGAAFPTGAKWDFTRRAAGEPKYVVCNADESEPGTFKDRDLLSALPHLLIEAMVLGGWVIGAHHGIIYLRHEYHPEGEVLQQAIDAAYRRGVLGDDCLGSGFAFELEIFLSPGGYILGEETALLEALEDRRGEPRNKPPFPTNVGLWDRPTLMNNVETFTAVPTILARGTQWWAAEGRGEHKGLKYVCVSGDVARPGVYCIPWGSSVAEVLERAGGMADGRALKAFSPGGASTNFLPARLAETPVDFDALAEAGSAMGTAALVLIGEGRDMLELGLSQARFFRNESCGKCVPCRIGTEKAVEIVEQGGNGGDTQALLQRLDRTLAKTSICGLGQVALGPLMSVFRQFPDEPAVRALNGETEADHE
ncbi:NADH-ubiquinone oxidoreductase-F iron-sulfur binding region domain-containing protein [Arhodomonas sp. SL1]|uniref:NADH-ubiquinone oxidoreductase-F iron-sulfur binding region domain-containing protein n=1 Tax=Arhodomonas sp. SL1 TaxID=3425691 RepID=UPI003F8837B7